jgi:CPA2 family monovalent cation:H+ antiporter-2
MPHETSLIALISVGLVLAFAAGFLANRLHLPPLVGYLLAGVVIGRLHRASSPMSNLPPAR